MLQDGRVGRLLLVFLSIKPLNSHPYEQMCRNTFNKEKAMVKDKQNNSETRKQNDHVNIDTEASEEGALANANIANTGIVDGMEDGEDNIKQSTKRVTTIHNLKKQGLNKTNAKLRRAEFWVKSGISGRYFERSDKTPGQTQLTTY